jgi:hypothetical protein
MFPNKPICDEVLLSLRHEALLLGVPTEPINRQEREGLSKSVPLNQPLLQYTEASSPMFVPWTGKDEGVEDALGGEL